MKQYFLKTFVFVGLLAVLTLPYVAARAATYEGVVNCVGVSERDSGDPRYASKPVCNFKELINTIDYLINFMFILVAPVVIALFSYAGFLIMTGKEDNVKKGKNFFWRVVYGLSFMLGSAIIVKTILFLLTKDEFNLTSIIK